MSDNDCPNCRDRLLIIAEYQLRQEGYYTQAAELEKAAAEIDRLRAENERFKEQGVRATRLWQDAEREKTDGVVSIGGRDNALVSGVANETLQQTLAEIARLRKECAPLRAEIEGLRLSLEVYLDLAYKRAIENEKLRAEIEELKGAVNYWQLAANHANEAKEVATNTYEVGDNVFQIVPDPKIEIDRLSKEVKWFKGKYEAAEDTLRVSDKLAAEAQAEIARLRAALENMTAERDALSHWFQQVIYETPQMGSGFYPGDQSSLPDGEFHLIPDEIAQSVGLIINARAALGGEDGK